MLTLYISFLSRKCDVINRGFSGYNTRWCNKMIPSVLSEFDAKNIAMVTIFLGANDSNLPANKQQHVPVNEFKQNLVEIVEKIQVLIVLSLLNTGNDNDRHTK